MDNSAQLGIGLLCVTCLVPFGLGAWAMWWFRNRLMAYGWPGAILPKFLRDRVK